MNFPWDCRSSTKFSRDDDQIFALNYENLCDIEYLNKLFATEITLDSVQLSSHPWLLTPDLPEDVLIFGRHEEIGIAFSHERSLYDDMSHGRLLDCHAQVIVRQVKVFSHIGRMVVLKCNEAYHDVSTSDEVAIDVNSRSHLFLPAALTCALKVVKDTNKKYFSRSSSLNSVLSLIAEVFHRNSNDRLPWSEFKLSSKHAHLLRAALCAGLRGGPAGEQVSFHSLKIAMSCAFCLYKVGMYLQSSSDVLLAMSHMLAVTVCIEERRAEEAGAHDTHAHAACKDSVSNGQERNRMKTKSRDHRLNTKASSPVPPQINDDNPMSEAVSGFDIKLGSEKTSWEKPILKSAVGKGSWKAKLHIQTLPTATRPERDRGEGGKQVGGFIIAPASVVAVDPCPVSTWRCSSNSDHITVKKAAGPAVSSKAAKNLNFSSSNVAPALLTSPPPRRSDVESYETVSIIPADLVQEVKSFCAVRNDDIGVPVEGKSACDTSRGLSTTAIWTCGQNSYGELGHGDVNLRRSFARSVFFNDKSISCVGAGNEHSVFVSSSGKIFVSGYNDNGQCGIGTTQQVRQPTVVSFLEDEDISNVFVFNGCEHTLVVTTEGKMFSFGYNFRGQLGVGNTCSEPVPRPIRGLMSRKVVMAACSYHHSIVACVDGTVFSFGRNDCGQLGHGDTTDKKVPGIVQGVQGPVVSMSCGQFHSIIVTKSGIAFACGKNDYGQLGLESSENVKLFSRVSTCPEGDSMLQVCCGYYHSLLLSQSGGVYCFGRNDYGQLGLGHTQPRMYGVTPNLYLRDKNVLSLAAGCYHSVAVTTNGMLYVFGRNNHGQLGTGDVDERHFPHPVDDFVGKKIIQVAAGFYHTIVLLATQGASNQENLFEFSRKQPDLMSSTMVQNSKPVDRTQQPNCEESVGCAPRLSSSSRDSQDFIDQPASNNNNRDAARGVSGSLDGANVKFRDFFVFTIAHLQSSVISNKPFGSHFEHIWAQSMSSEDALIGMNWASLQMNTFTVLLQMCRQYLSGSLAIDLPFSQDEILSTLTTLVTLVDQFATSLDQARVLPFLRLPEHCLDHDQEVLSEVLTQYSPSLPVFSFEYIVGKLTNRTSCSSSDTAETILGEVSAARTDVADSIRNIRQELLFVYFYLSESFDASPVIGQQCGLVLAKHFELMFWSPVLRRNFFAFVCDVLTEVLPAAAVDLFDTTSSFTSLLLSAEMDCSVDYSRCAALLTRVCIKFRNFSEVIAVFRRSSREGLEVYHKMLIIYNHLSTVRVKSACDLDVDLIQDPNEFARLISLMEHCCAHFTKCAVPLLFAEATGQGGAGVQDVSSTSAVGSLIVDSLFCTAEAIIDVFLSLDRTAQSHEVVNSESNLPIIFPTFLLYALSNVEEVSHVRFQVRLGLSRLTGKLQTLISKLELDYDCAGRSLPSSKKRMEENQSFPRGVAEANPQRDELFAQTPWWARLLKLCSILSAKLSHVLICRGSPSVSNNEATLCIHPVWAHWAGPEDVFRFHLLSVDEASSPSDEALVEFRRVAALSNHTYRTIIAAASANKTIDILSGIESCLLDAVRRSSLRHDIQAKDMHAIAALTTHMFTQRAVLMSRCDGLLWKDMLLMIRRVVDTFRVVLRACEDKSRCTPLLLPRKNVHPALRRSLLVMMCLNRWKSSAKHKFSARSSSVVSAFQYVLNRTVHTINPFDEKSLMMSWKEVLSELQHSSDAKCDQAVGMECMGNLLLCTPQASIRIDIMSLLASCWKSNRPSPNASGHLTATSENERSPSREFSTAAAKSQHKLAYVFLMNVVQCSIKQFCDSLSKGNITGLSTELSLLYCNVKYLQLVLADKNNSYSLDLSKSTLSHLKVVLISIDEKFAEMQNMDDRSSGSGGGPGGGAAKRQSAREKSAQMRRTASSIVCLLQTIAASTVNTRIHNFSKQDILAIVSVHFHLIRHFQSIRLSLKADSVALLRHEARDGRGKEVSSHRRRCQELIIAPMQFSRVQEGFVVQGEKLLSNFKGIDFTLACWIFVTKKTAGRSSFLVGKVSHNDAWPLVTLRAADMKAEIIFGRANEFERLSSHASIPLHVWTHIAVVVEPRKIKLFINGSIDSQVTTAGNARAILYPVIIGACPSGVRTRVDCIKEGFDGLLSHLKYYTRALSPIHVRVIFDKGPPEAHDAREHLSYQLLASVSVMLNTSRGHLCQAPHLCCDLLATLHCLFLSDSSRLRLGSLKVLQKVLLLGIVEDFPLSLNELNFNSKVHHDNGNVAAKGSADVQVATLMKAEFLGPFSSFEERIVFYFVRLMGVCWHSSVVKKDKSKLSYLDNIADTPSKKQVFDSILMLEELLSHCPSFVSPSAGDSSQADGGGGMASEGGAIEDPVPREDLIVETCQAINHLLRSLSQVDYWRLAISRVLQHCMREYMNMNKADGAFARANMCGVAVLVGELPMCPFVGAEVGSSCLAHPATVLSLDKATSQATLLTFNASKTNIQFVTVKTSELVELSGKHDSLLLSDDVTDSIILLMSQLSAGVGCLMTDCLSISRRDQSFTHDYILKSCLPYEIFLFYHLVRRVSRSAASTVSQQRAVFDVLKHFSIRAANNNSAHDKVSAGAADSQIGFMWIRSLSFISNTFPRHELELQQLTAAGVDSACSDENDLCESVLTTHLDISPESFKSQYSALLKSGHVTEFIHCAAAVPGSDMVSLVPLDSGTATSRMFTVDISTLASRSDSPDPKAKMFFQMLFEMRECMIKCSRLMVHSECCRLDEVQLFRLPWKVAIWQSMVKDKEHSVFSNDLRILFGLCTKLLTHDGVEVTASLVGGIKYALTALFRKKSNGLFDVSESILQSTDVFTRLLLAALSWLRTHENTVHESLVCYEILYAFLPLLPVVADMDCEVTILSLCALAAQRVVILHYSGHRPSTDIVSFVKSEVFSFIWTRAQERLVLERGHSVHNFSPVTQHLASIASSFLILQRCNVSLEDIGSCSRSPVKSPEHLSRMAIPVATPLSLPLIKVRAARARSAELDMTGAFTLWDSLAPQSQNKDLVVEVVLCVRGDGSSSDVADDNAYETIYCGSSSSFVHFGLSPSSLYCVKYRVVSHPSASDWSDVTEFRTDVGTTPFVFDTTRCGSDIIVSSDGRVASYSGDDNWSTVLGSSPFTSGINSWEVKIVASSTAYIFVGIASSLADLNTFLGGCAEGWGFIGEQALYHGREKVKIYGEQFSAGDIVGVILDFNSGTLSFTRNGKTLGIAFDKIYGELFPAVAFYNAGQEVEIVADSFRTFCPPVPFPCSPAIVNLDQFGLLSEMMYCLSMRKSFSLRVLGMIMTHLKSWCSGNVVRKRATSGRYLFLNKDSTLLKKLDLSYGDRVRTQYGIADICGSAYGRVWFTTKEKEGAWYFSKQQISAGRAKGLFLRCSYSSEEAAPPGCADVDASAGADTGTGTGAGVALLGDLDLAALQENLDPERWSADVDKVLMDFLQDTAEKENVSPWEISSQRVCDSFRTIQLNFSRFVLDSVELSHKWGVAGPKRKAVLARLGVIRLYNHLLEHSLPLLLPSVAFGVAGPNALGDDLAFTCVSMPHSNPSAHDCNAQGTTFQKRVSYHGGRVLWPLYNFSWESKNKAVCGAPAVSPTGQLCSMTRNVIFSDLKRSHFWKILHSSTARVSKTDDDYDYPEDLPLVKLNRFKSFRAVEASELLHIPGEDLVLTSMFSQLWKELRQHSAEKLRISYTHPMDDGQSRTFKVRFEGEGVDDYGGPYREVFQKICEELKIQDLSASGSAASPTPCFIPLLHPTPNWSAEDCEERYKYTFLPSAASALSLDLFKFLGQLVGVALRSKITLELPLASFIWKSVVREPLSDRDIASFDAPASRFVEYIGSLHKKISGVTLLGSQEQSLVSLTEELGAVLQDVTWTVTFSDGRTNNLVQDGHAKRVLIEDVGEYLELYCEARLGESFAAVEAFRAGLLWVVPESAISVLAWDELEYLVCGSKHVDVERLKKNTEYDDDISANDDHIINFWEILESFSEKEKSSFLRFVWARPTLPPNGIDFPQKLKIQSAVGDDSSASPDSYLPKAHTCFFSINLPRYSSKLVMRERLLYAITHCTEMDADFRVTEEEVVGWSSLPAAQNWSSYSGTD